MAGGRHLLGSFLYCCALNHKQMAMYYAPAFFGHLLGTCLQRPGMGGKVRSCGGMQPDTVSSCHASPNSGEDGLPQEVGLCLARDP